MSEKHSKIVFLDSLACSDTPCWLPELFVIFHNSDKYHMPVIRNHLVHLQLVKLMQIYEARCQTRCNEEMRWHVDGPWC